MKFNKKQLMLGLLFVALASRMFAADYNPLIVQARELALQLQLNFNQTGSDLVHRLIQRVEHLMPLRGQYLDQTARITSLEEKVAQAHRQREAIVQLLGGVQTQPVIPVASSAPAQAELVALELPSTTSSSSSCSSSSSSSLPSSEVLTPSRAVIRIGRELLERAENVRFNQAMDCYNAKNFNDAFNQFLAIAEDETELRPVRAKAYAALGALSRISGQANIDAYKTALAFFNNAQALCDESEEALMNNIDKNIDELTALAQAIDELPPLAPVERTLELQDDQDEASVAVRSNKRSTPTGKSRKSGTKRTRTAGSRNEAANNFCIVCQHTFSSKGNFKRHMKNNPTHRENQLLPPASGCRTVDSPNDSETESEKE